MYVYGNSGWESLKSGGDEGNTDVTPQKFMKSIFSNTAKYPLEIPIQKKTGVNSARYWLDCDYSNFGNVPVYVIAKFDDSGTIGYTLSHTIDTTTNPEQVYYDINIGAVPTEMEIDYMENGCKYFRSSDGSKGVYEVEFSSGLYEDDNEELSEYSGVYAIYTDYTGNYQTNGLPVSIILDTEYNTTKYPERIPVFSPE